MEASVDTHSLIIQRILAVLLLSFAVLAGWKLAVARIGFLGRVAVYLFVFCMANAIECLPSFTSDHTTWLMTYISGGFLVGIVLFVVAVVPSIIAYHVTKACMRRNGKRI
jgi:hypothetical protein